MLKLQNKDIKNVNKSGDNINLNLIITEMKKVKKRVKKLKAAAQPPAPEMITQIQSLPDLPQYNYRQLTNIGNRPYAYSSAEVNPSGIPEIQQNMDYVNQLRQQQMNDLTQQIQNLASPAEQPIEQTAEQPIEQPAEQPIEQPIEQPAEQPIEQPIEQPAEQPEFQMPPQIIQEINTYEQQTQFFVDLFPTLEKNERRRYNRALGNLKNKIINLYNYLGNQAPAQLKNESSLDFISRLISILKGGI